MIGMSANKGAWRKQMSVSREILNIALKQQVVDKDENLVLWKAARADAAGLVDPDATGRALCANLIHIVRAAEEFTDSGPISSDDLVSEGCILLVTAYISKYDPDRGASIKSFLRQALRRDFVKIVSRSGQPGITMPMGRLTQIAKMRSNGDKRGADALRRGAATENLETEVQSHNMSPADEVEQSETLYRLRIAMSELDDRERDVISSRFAVEQETFQVIGRRWGVTKERARQVEREALAKLRKALSSLE